MGLITRFVDSHLLT